ncbi:MAG: DUF58 domain-containing protein [Clostridiales bacterium]|nr:DUF58 domain-containing protein [Clostridiales bacterium]
MNALVILFVLAVMNLLFDLVLRGFALKGMQCQRRFSVPCAYEGDTVEVVEVVRNDRPLLVPWLRMESRISRHLRFGRQDNLKVSGDMYHRSLFMLMPYQQITRRHKVRLLHRGAYDIGNVTITAGDLLGLACASCEQNLSAPILVYPRLLQPEEMPKPLYRLLGEITVHRRLLQDPFLVDGLRPYHQGDHVRDIHWAATARTGELQVRTHDFTADTRLMVIINSQLSSHQWGDLMDYEQGPVEYAISVAATLCVEAMRRGVNCGFGASMPLKDQDKCVIFPPGTSIGEEELLAAMARLQVRFVKRFTNFLDEVMTFTGMDILILSVYESPEIQVKMQALRDAGNTVQLHLLDREEGRRES